MRETYLKQHLALLKNENNFLCSVNDALATMKTIKKIKSFKKKNENFMYNMC